MKAKRITVSVISFIISVALIVSVVPVSYMLRNDSNSTKNITGFYGEKNNTLDMVYIGGSACYVYWEPLRAWNDYGYTSYNFAADTLAPQSIKYIIKEIKKTQSPKLLVIDARPFQYGEEQYEDTDTINMYNETAIRNTIDSLNYSRNRNDLIRCSVPEFKDRYSYYFDIAKYHSLFSYKLHSVISGDYLPIDQIDNSTYNKYKGFVFINWGGREKQNFVDYSSVKEEQKLSDTLNDLFYDLLDYCKNEDFRVLFVVHSYRQTKEDKMKYNYMARIIKEYGFDYLNANDYYEEVGLNYSNDMYNSNHVNIFGAEKYTDFLAKYINDNYSLPDHRSDASYSEWNDCYIASLEDTKKTKEITANSELRTGENNEQ